MDRDRQARGTVLGCEPPKEIWTLNTAADPKGTNSWGLSANFTAHSRFSLEERSERPVSKPAAQEEGPLDGKDEILQL